MGQNSFSVPSKSSGGGHDGLSAYQIAVKDGFVGTEAEWLASLVGATGPEGPVGPSGTTEDPGDLVAIFEQFLS